MVFRLGSNDVYRYYKDELEANLGSAYSRDNDGIIYVYKMAYARQLSSVEQLQEKVVNESMPNTAWDAAEDWSNRLGVIIKPDDNQDTLRIKNTNQYSIISLDNKALITIEEFASQIFGDFFVQIMTSYTDDIMVSPPQQSNNPYPGWFSDRCFLAIQIQNINSDNLLDFLNRAEEFDNLMATIMPAWVRYDWVINNETDGFELDVSELDLNGIF